MQKLTLCVALAALMATAVPLEAQARDHGWHGHGWHGYAGHGYGWHNAYWHRGGYVIAPPVVPVGFYAPPPPVMFAPPPVYLAPAPLSFGVSFGR